MSRSKGTKATQGINGDAANLGRWLDASAGATTPGTVRTEACQYGHHRRTDWVTPTSQLICGVCHPPAAEYEGITRRGEAGFDELVIAASARIVRRQTDELEVERLHREHEEHGIRLGLLDDGEPVDLEAAAVSLPSAYARFAQANLDAITLEAEELGVEVEALELDQALDVALEADR